MHNIGPFWDNVHESFNFLIKSATRAKNTVLAANAT